MRTAPKPDPAIASVRPSEMMDSRTTPANADPYRRCEEGCTHDLAAAVLIEELRGGDGPFSPLWEPEGAGGGFLLWAHRRAQGNEESAA